MVKDPNVPELGVGVYETVIPFEVNLSLHGFNGKADYILIISATIGSTMQTLDEREYTVDVGVDLQSEFSFLIHTGTATQVGLTAALYRKPPAQRTFPCSWRSKNNHRY